MEANAVDSVVGRFYVKNLIQHVVDCIFQKKIRLLFDYISGVSDLFGIRVYFILILFCICISMIYD